MTMPRGAGPFMQFMQSLKKAPGLSLQDRRSRPRGGPRSRPRLRAGAISRSGGKRGQSIKRAGSSPPSFMAAIFFQWVPMGCILSDVIFQIKRRRQHCLSYIEMATMGPMIPEKSRNGGLSNCFSVISLRAYRKGFLHLFFPAGQVQVLAAG